MLKNAALDAKIGVDTAENELEKEKSGARMTASLKVLLLIFLTSRMKVAMILVTNLLKLEMYHLVLMDPKCF